MDPSSPVLLGRVGRRPVRHTRALSAANAKLRYDTISFSLFPYMKSAIYIASRIAHLHCPILSLTLFTQCDRKRPCSHRRLRGEVSTCSYNYSEKDKRHMYNWERMKDLQKSQESLRAGLERVQRTTKHVSTENHDFTTQSKSYAQNHTLIMANKISSNNGTSARASNANIRTSNGCIVYPRNSMPDSWGEYI